MKTNALIFIAAAALAPLAATAIEHAGVWTHADDRGTFSLSLGADGSCEVAAFETATRKARKTRCRYSLDGSKIRLRAHVERDREAFNSLDIEHLGDSNTLLLRGDRPRVLRRNTDHWRQD